MADRRNVDSCASQVHPDGGAATARPVQSALPLAPVEFFFDFISPFGYFASLAIDDMAARHGRTVDWTSMLVGVSVLKVMGLPPIVDLPMKGDYIVRDALRYARQHGVPFERSPTLPGARPLAAGRAFAWAKTVDPQAAKQLALALYQSYFVECRDIGAHTVVCECLVSCAFDAADYARAQRAGIPTALLARNVEASLEKSVFGSPFFIADGEPFFGVEKMHVLNDWLRTGGW
jgi:2-hydroxychromene-2-carboxylate isomerase